jgi:hypothetical protein
MSPLEQVRAKIAEEKKKAKEGDNTDEETEQERKERWHDIHHDGTGTHANLDAIGRPRHLFHKKVWPSVGVHVCGPLVSSKSFACFELKWPPWHNFF